MALGKATVNGAGAVTVAFLCQVPPGLSAKRVLPINFLPCVLCRVPHLAKALPSAIWPGTQAKNLNPIVVESSSGVATATFQGEVAAHYHYCPVPNRMLIVIKVKNN